MRTVYFCHPDRPLVAAPIDTHRIQGAGGAGNLPILSKKRARGLLAALILIAFAYLASAVALAALREEADHQAAQETATPVSTTLDGPAVLCSPFMRPGIFSEV